MLQRRSRQLHANETGAEEGMNKLLIFALVAIPLIILLISFGNQIVSTATAAFDGVIGSGVTP